MALLYITEYSNAAQSDGVPIQAGQEPALVYQTPVVIGAGSLQSALFNAGTRFVRVHADVICSVAFGISPTAVAQTQNRMAANQTEFFGVPPGGAHRLAVIAST